MSKSMKLSAFYEKPELLMKLFGWVSAGVMLFNMVLICCDVFMRYAFNSPIQGTTEIVTMLMAWVDQFWASWLIKEKSVAAVTVYVFIGKFGCFLGWLLLAIQGAFMTVYCAVGIARPNQVDPILIKSELPSEDELGAFGVEGTQNAEKDGDG